MDITITPGRLSGAVEAIPSKSQAHRLLICAAFSDGPTQLLCPETNRDIEATADCLRALGASVVRTASGYTVEPIRTLPEKAELNCCESGSTLRFLLPIVGALGVNARFFTEGRLSSRPLSPLWEEMQRMGCLLEWIDSNTLSVLGQLQPGEYTIDGGVSSQFITGLLFALSLLPGSSAIVITGRLESKPYVDLTRKAMALYGIDTTDLHVTGGQVYRSPGRVTVEGDWSGGAFWLAATALGSDLNVTNLDPKSPQGDRKAAELFPLLSQWAAVDGSDIPDLVPILSVVAAANQGARFTNIRRLRMKESDRVASTVAMLEALGGKAEASEDTLTVYGTGLTGGTVDACNDHRIAMSAAIAATVCREPVTILGAQCVQKSYPQFWSEYSRLGGKYELYLR